MTTNCINTRAYLNDEQFVPIVNALKNRGFKILEEDENGILIQNPVSKVAMICHKQPKTAVDWLKRHGDDCNHYPLLLSMQPELSDEIGSVFIDKVRSDCAQVIWTDASHSNAERPENFKILPADHDDLKWILSRYDLASQEEMEEAMENGELFVGWSGDKRIGYIGVHSEGSMGMLEILPEYRHQGFAGILEEIIATEMIKSGLIPYAHIFKSNKASLSLQKKLNLSFSKYPVSWFFEQE